MAPSKSSGSGSRRAETVTTNSKAKAKLSGPIKQIFAGKFFSLTGDFGEAWTYDKVVNWIKVHGGRYEREVGVNTTHLVCTIETYNKENEQVRKALAKGKKCHIVSKDWLEDCLVPSNDKKRCLREKGYSLNTILKRVRDGLKKKEEYRQKFEDGVNLSREMMDNPQFAALNHIYIDNTGFEYKVICTRFNTVGKTKSEKYTVYLFESHAKPSTYTAGAKLTSPGRSASYWRSEFQPKMFRDAFHDFKWWFKYITGIEWDNRLDGIPKPKDKFKYDVPKLGRPVGLLPADKKAPTWDEDSESDEGLFYDSSSEFEDELIEEDDEKGAKKPRLDTSIEEENSVETRLINAMAGRPLKQSKVSISKDNRGQAAKPTRPQKGVKKPTQKKPAQREIFGPAPLDSAILVKKFAAGDAQFLRGLHQTVLYPAADDDIDSDTGLPTPKTPVRPQKQLKLPTMVSSTPTKHTSAFEMQYDMRPSPFRPPPSTPSGKRKRPSHAAEKVKTGFVESSPAEDPSTLVSPSPSTPKSAKTPRHTAAALVSPSSTPKSAKTPRATAATLVPHKRDTSSLTLKTKKNESVAGQVVSPGMKRPLETESSPTNLGSSSPGGIFTSTAVFFPTSTKKESKRSTTVINLTGD